MKPINISLAGALLCAASGASASDIFPVPQSYVADGSTAFSMAGSTFRLTGAETADADAVALLGRNLETDVAGTVEIIIGEAGDDAIAPYESKIPQQAQGYYLSVAAGRIVVAGRDGEGTYYGVQSLLQHLDAPEIAAAEVTDSPDNPVRGIVEGYYGNPWSHADRLDMMERFMGHAKMNVYIYGPKDDNYHHGSHVFDPYPEETATRLSEVARKGLENKVHFVWAMHPGNSIEGDDMDRAVSKFESMYELGIRQFGIFFDDVFNYDVNKQVAFINHVNTSFIKAHSDIKPLIVCPSQYNRSWAGDGSYLTAMGAGTDADVQIMWTGGGVVDQKLGDASLWFAEKSGRKPFIWLNYPCNDHGYANHALQLSPYSPADPNIAEVTTGFTANPMEYYEASKVGLYGIADFTWNVGAYDPLQSWERILGFIMPDNKDAFRTYCQCNFDYPQPGHNVVIPYEETPDFKALTETHAHFDAAASADFAQFFTTQVNTGRELLGLTDSRFVAEVLEFIRAYQLQGERGLVLSDMRAALDATDGPAFIEAYRSYKQMTDSAETLISRNYEGSLRKYKGNSGNKYVEPFILATVNDLIGEFYRGGYDYPEGLFPAQLIASGNYFIKYRDRWLSNGTGDSSTTPSRPTFKANEDNINPARQSWLISYDMANSRYKITSAHDGRYLNEKGVFGTNEFFADWNTYEITSLNGKFAIRNGGSAGTDFWGVTGSEINGKAHAAYTPDAFVFELVATDGSAVADTTVVLSDDVKYVITDSDGRVLRRGSDNSLYFTQRPERLTLYHKFTVTRNANGRYEIRSARADKAFINEKGNIVTGAFYDNWNTYELYEHNGRFAIRNADAAGTEYWFVNGDRIDKKEQTNIDAYHFIFEDADNSAISEITGTDTPAEAIFDLQGRRIVNPSRGIYIVNGQKTLVK